MASLTVSKIGIAQDTRIQKVKMGGAADIGNSVYLDTTGNTWKQADNTAAANAGQSGIGIMLTTSLASGDWAVIAVSGGVKFQAASGNPTKGDTYVVGGTAGSIADDADAVSGDYKTILLVGSTEGASTNDFYELKMQTFVSNEQI